MPTYIAEDNADSAIPFAQAYDPFMPLFAGNGSISGQVLEQGVPVVRRVMLFERDSGLLYQTTYSDSNGNYRFTGLKENLLYFVISLDESGDSKQYNLVGQDLLRGDYDTSQ